MVGRTSSNQEVTMPRVVESKTFRDEQTAAIEKIIAASDGDMRGAVKALLLVNEQLESDLQQLYAAVKGAQIKFLTKPVLH
jgi:hypothetical protein